MNSKNEVFEYLIGQLRQQVNNNQCEDLAHEVQSLKNQLRDASALVAELQRGAAIPSKASLSVNDAAWVLHDALAAKGPINGAQFNILKVAFYDAMLVALGKGVADTEQSGCRKEDTQYNAWGPHYGARQPVPDGTMVFIRYRNGEEPKHSVAAEKRSWIWDGTYADIVEYKINTQKCKHEWEYYYPHGEEHRRRT
ncbi:TPA: hypothetical protein ACP2C6_004690, partial [Escherichia coli]